MSPGRKRTAAALSCMALLVGCQWQATRTEAGPRYTETITTVLSRGVAVPVTFVTPGTPGGDRFPLVVMAHGHGGSREEAGGFTQLARALAESGMASIRMDFPGCGDSREPFTENHLSNMLADIGASLRYALGHPAVDPGRVAMLGYSMGGRLALLASRRFEFHSIVAWAPVTTDGASGMYPFLGGAAAYESLKAEAQSRGYAQFTTPWGQHQALADRWFAEMESSRPLEAARSFNGPLLVVQGRDDEVIPPAVGAALVEAAANSVEARLHVVDHAGHGLGFYDDAPLAAAEVVEVTVRFLEKHLVAGE